MSVTPCEYARDRHAGLVRWRNLWTILVFAVGVVATVFVLVAIVFFATGNHLVGAVTTLGTILEGVAMGWILKRRREATDEEEKAYADVKAQCTPPTAGAPATAKAAPEPPWSPGVAAIDDARALRRDVLGLRE
jgi:hypothetical protein